jgi:membrane protein DedA with SNARE-associated domain
LLTEVISEFAIHVLDTTGYAGAAFLMGLESMVFPVPSEAVMPFVGFLVADGKWGLFEAILATSIGSFLGSYLSYLMGYYGGRPFVLSVGKYLLLDKHDLEMTERFFHRRGGALTLFLSRFIPVVRHLVSIPAGIGKMRFWPFAIATTAGATLWNGFLLYCGTSCARTGARCRPTATTSTRSSSACWWPASLVRGTSEARRAAPPKPQVEAPALLRRAGAFAVGGGASGKGSRPGRSRDPAPAR